MPRYDYRCLCCGSIIERVAGREDSMITEYCPTCDSSGVGGSQLFQRIISGKPPVVILKGECWEKDGYSGASNEKKQEGKDKG